jgi:hypothetical protein
MSKEHPPIQVLPLPSCAAEWVSAEVNRIHDMPREIWRFRWEPAKDLCARMHSTPLLTDLLRASREAEDTGRYTASRSDPEAWQTIYSALLAEVAARLDHRAECQSGTVLD